MANKNKLFVTGAGRSGTTFLWKVLNNSSEVYLSTEIHYFSALYHNGFLKNFKRLTSRNISPTLDDVFNCIRSNKNFGMYWRKTSQFTFSEIESYFRDKLVNEKNIYLYLIEHDYKFSGKHKINVNYIGEKTPLNIFHVRKLFKWFPNAKILFLYRNPIDVLKSEVNKSHKPDYPLKKKNPLYPYGLMMFVFFEWLLAAVIALYNATTNKENFIVISFEKLTAHQVSTVQKICSMLDIRYDEDMCEFKKIASSYLDGGEKSYWYPPKWVVFLYALCLHPLRSLLNNESVEISIK